GQDQLPAPLDEQAEGRKCFHNAGRIGDDHLTVFFFQRHVVVHAQEHTFAVDIQIFNSQFCHKSGPLIKGPEDSQGESRVKGISGTIQSRSDPSNGPDYSLFLAFRSQFPSRWNLCRKRWKTGAKTTPTAVIKVSPLNRA